VIACAALFWLGPVCARFCLQLWGVAVEYVLQHHQFFMFLAIDRHAGKPELFFFVQTCQDSKEGRGKGT